MDTEFMEEGPFEPIYLISIGIVAEDGREYYAECSETLDPEPAHGTTPKRVDPPIAYSNTWVKKNVVPHLKGGECRKRRWDIKEDIIKFMGLDKGETPEIWGYFCDYDWVVFCGLFGRMADLPKGLPYFCLDLKQRMFERGIERQHLSPDPEGEHNALVDARWNKKVFQEMDDLEYFKGKLFNALKPK